jgi:hypothetical protein
VLVADHQWRDFDRGFLRLKRGFFGNAIRASGERDERWEFKGHRISTPSRQGNQQSQRFARGVLNLLQRLGCILVAKGRVKPQGPGAHDPEALYTSTVQGLMRAMERCLRNMGSQRHGVGIIVIDRRGQQRDLRVIASAQSHLFSRQIGPDIAGFERVLESPLLVDSKYYHGVQVADIVCGILGGVLRWRAAPTHSAQYQTIDQRYGSTVDSLTYQIGTWRSVWVD